jgi:hypothetical protein
MRGLYRYQTARDRWWACFEDDSGNLVNVVRSRYEQMKIQPSFDALPIEDDGAKKSRPTAD